MVAPVVRERAEGGHVGREGRREADDFEDAREAGEHQGLAKGRVDLWVEVERGWEMRGESGGRTLVEIMSACACWDIAHPVRMMLVGARVSFHVNRKEGAGRRT